MNITILQRRRAYYRDRRPVTDCLREAGHHVRECDDGADEDVWDCDLLWLQGNAAWYPRICRGLERMGTRRPKVVLWHTEPLPPRPGSGFRSSTLHLREIVKILLRDRRATDPYTNAARIRRLSRMGMPDVLVVSARSRQLYLASRNIKSHFVPLGYHPGAHGRLLELPRTVDILFLGTMQVPRRRRLVAHLRRAGVDVRTEGSWNRPETWGEHRVELLNKTKILLNLQRHAGEFSGIRMILGMCSGAMIISEPVDQPEPYRPGVHYIETPVEQMPSAIRYYLEHTDKREQITAEAYRFVTQNLSMSASVQKVLTLFAMRDSCT